MVCGTNQRLQYSLNHRFAGRPDIRIHRYVADMCWTTDRYLTKPGNISTTEAVGKGLPMVLADAVATYEEQNKIIFIAQAAL